MVATELAASARRSGRTMSFSAIMPCSANEANTVHAVPKKQATRICARLPCSVRPGLNRKKNGTKKPPMASFTA